MCVRECMCERECMCVRECMCGVRRERFRDGCVCEADVCVTCM